MASNIARFDPVTESWAALGAGLGAAPKALALLPNGEIVVAGQNLRRSGTRSDHILLYNTTTNTYRALGTGVNDGVNAVAVLPSGELAVAGRFTSAGSVGTSRIAIFDPQTSVWRPLGSGVNGEVHALAVLPSGQIVVGGSFTAAGGTPASRIAAYDPITETWDPLGPGVDLTVRALVVDLQGTIFAGGDFRNAGDVTARGIAAYDPSTQLWSNVGDTFQETALALLADGRVVAGSLGIRDPMTNTWGDLGAPLNGRINALGTTPANDVIAGGTFWNSGGEWSNPSGSNLEYGVGLGRIGRYSVSSRRWSPLGSGTYGTPLASMELADGRLLVAGSITHIERTAVQRIAIYDEETGWTNLGTGVQGTIYSPVDYATVWAVTELSNGDILAAGNFTTAGGTDSARIARFSPSTDQWSSLDGLTSGGPIYTLAKHPNGNVLVGGSFHAYISAQQPPVVSHVGFYNPESQMWLPLLNTPSTETVLCSTVLPGGDIVIGGTFSTLDGVPASNIALYQIATRTWHSLSSGTNGTVRALLVLPSGEIVVGGDFAVAGGVPAARIAVYSPTSGLWSPLGSGVNNIVYALTQFASGDLVVGGIFTSAGGVTTGGLATYSFVTGTWQPVRPGLTGTVRSLTVRSSGDLVVGGTFESASGVPARRLCVLRFDAPVIADDPDDLSIRSGSTRQLNAEVTATLPVSYRWQKDGVNLNDDAMFTGVRTPTLSIRGEAASQSGEYRLVAWTACGTVVTDAAIVNVLCVADVSMDMAVDSDDTIVFFDLWSRADGAADVDEDAEVDGDDVVFFFDRFEAGC